MKLFCIKCQQPITQIEYTQGAMYCNSCRKDMFEEQAKKAWLDKIAYHTYQFNQSMP